MKLLADDRDQYIDGHGAPDLCLHRILARAEKLFDAQVLLDPLEEQFDLPPAFVKRGDGERGQCCVVGQKHQRLARRGVFEPNAPHVLGVMLAGVKTIEPDALIADHARGPVDSVRVHAAGVHTTLGAREEEGPSLMYLVKPGKVQITTIHHVERPRLDRQDVQHIDVVHFAVADVDKGRNGPTQIQQGVQFDSGFGRPKRRPIEQAQAQIDGAGVQRVDGVGQIRPQVLAIVQFAGPANKQGGDIRPDAPIPQLVRLCQSGTAHAVTQAHSIEFVGIGTQGGLDIAQTFAPGQLREGQHPKLLGAGHAAHPGIARVAIDYAGKARPRDKVHDLCEQRLADIHMQSPTEANGENYTNLTHRVSNRHQMKSAAKPRRHWVLACA